MTNITIYKSNDIYKGILVSGHTGFAQEGEDIVCAGISALTINFVNSVEKLTDDKFDIKTDDGVIDFSFDNEPSKESELLFESLLLGLNNIKNDYNEFISILIEEE